MNNSLDNTFVDHSQDGVRRCLRCDTLFQSVAPYNRICKPCSKCRDFTVNMPPVCRGEKRWNGLRL